MPCQIHSGDMVPQMPTSPSSIFVQRFKKPLYQIVTGFAFLVCLLGAFFSRSHPLVYGWMAVLFLGSNLYLTFSKKPDIRRAERLNLMLGTEPDRILHTPGRPIRME